MRHIAKFMFQFLFSFSKYAEESFDLLLFFPLDKSINISYSRDTQGFLCKCVKCLHNKDVGNWNKENKTIFHPRVACAAAQAAVRGAFQMTYSDNIQLQMIAAYTSDDLTAAFTPQSPQKKFSGEKSANEKTNKTSHTSLSQLENCVCFVYFTQNL